MELELACTVAAGTTPSPRVAAVAGMFGLGLDPDRQVTLIPPTRLTLRTGQVVFITGASGGGKSTLLRKIAEAVTHRGGEVTRVGDAELPDRPLVDLLPEDPLDRTLSRYARAGLNDAFVLLRHPRQLSDGQRCRLQLALALAAAERATGPGLRVILADEFGATLDRVTAAVIARNLRKWTTRTGICFIAATTHDDLLGPLDPDLVIEKGLGPRLSIAERDSPQRAQRTPSKGKSESNAKSNASAHSASSAVNRKLPITPGTLEDYRQLADLHYKAGRPATATRVWACRTTRPTVVGRYLGRRATPETVAVLVESLPSLSCAMRDVATAGRYRGVSAKARAMMLNDEVRTISRVIVHPQWRGLGLARQLVQRALATATTPYVEAIAAMGQVHPFFEQAGMTRYDRPPHPVDARLLDALATVDLTASELVDTPTVRQRIARAPLLDRELRRWHTTAVRGDPAADLPVILDAARQRLLFTPSYFLWRKGNP